MIRKCFISKQDRFYFSKRSNPISPRLIHISAFASIFIRDSIIFGRDFMAFGDSDLFLIMMKQCFTYNKSEVIKTKDANFTRIRQSSRKILLVERTINFICLEKSPSRGINRSDNDKFKALCFIINPD